MKTIALYALAIFIVLGNPTSSLWAQKSPIEAEIDSLKQSLSQYSRQDTNYVYSLMRLGTKLKFREPKVALAYMLEAKELVDEKAYVKLQAKVYNILGITYTPQNMYAESLASFRKALAFAREAGHIRLVGEINNNMGNVYKRIGDYAASLEAYLEAEKAYDASDYFIGMARTSNNLGNLFKNKGQFEQAEQQYLKAMKAYKDLGHSPGYVNAQLNLGGFYTGLGRLAEAEILLDSALQYYLESDLKSEIAITYNSLGNLYKEKGEISKAKDYLTKARQIANEIGLRNVSFFALYNLAEMLTKEKNFSEALELASEADKVAKESGVIGNLADSKALKSFIYESMEDYQQALYNFQDRIDLVDSMDTQEEKSFYQNLQTQREVYIREQEIKSQAAQLHLLEDKVSLENRWKWTLGIASIILFLGGILYFQRYKRSQKLAKDLEFQNELILNQKAEIEAMDKVKTRFFTNISHEFRTPLNLILGPLRDKQGPIPPMELGMMQRNAERLLRLINQMLDLSKLEVGEMQMHYENTDIYAFLQELAEAFQSQADLKSIQYHIDIPPGNKLMQVDVEKLEHIIYNLLSNAFKFTPQGGKVGFYAALEPNNQLRMAVSDSGLGIPQHLQGKIFERFYQVDGSTTRAFEGTGIGLSLTKELTELYGGSIQLESEENRGCRFTLLLPLLPYDPKLELEKSMQLSAPISESPFASSAIEEQIPPTEDMIQILLVEDHQELRQYLKKQLGEQYRSMEAANGKDGLDTAKEKLPDVIISDVMMPEMDGIEMTQHLKNDPLTSHIPIILLTAKDDPNTRREGFDLGADQYLSKPFDTQELHARIKSVVQQSQRLQEKYSKSIFLKPTELEIEDHEARFLERAMEVVENHMDDSEFSVSDMQEEIGMSRMQLHRKLKALSGKSSSEFIRYIRLQRAAELLKHPGSQVADVAYRVGFNHLSYFAKCFKEEFGSVPSVYKESHA